MVRDTQTVIIVFSMRAFLLLEESLNLFGKTLVSLNVPFSVSKFDLPYHCMNIYFRVLAFYAVLTVGFIESLGTRTLSL